MRRSLKGKLILSYLAVALITVLVVSALIRLTSGQSLMSLVVEQQTALLKESGADLLHQPTARWMAFSSYYLQNEPSRSPARSSRIIPSQPPGYARYPRRARAGGYRVPRPDPHLRL